MKKLILLLSVVFLTTTALQAQDSKFYLGIGVGYSTASGDMADSDQYGAESGVNLKFIDMGYRSMKLGVLLLAWRQVVMVLKILMPTK